jgi:hypothetical protein
MVKPKEVVEQFSHYFAEIAQKLTSEYKLPYTSSNDNINQIPFISKTFFHTPVTTQEVTSVIKNLKNKKSTGLDEVPSLLVKKASM